MKKKLNSFWNRVLKSIRKPEMQVLPGQLAFFFVLSIIPLIALVGGIASFFSISIDTIKDLLYNSFPKDAANLLIPIITGKGLNFNMTIFFFSAFFLASNGAKSMIIASNQLYKIKNRDFIRLRIKSILMTIILVSLLVFVLLVPAFGDTIVRALSNFFHDEKLYDVIFHTYQILKYPISLFLIYFNIKLLYTLAPDQHIPSYTTTYGALFTTVTWIILTEVYSIYVDVFARYDIFYGSISNIIILLLWVYLLAYVFVFGMALNVSYMKEEGMEEQK